MSEKYLLVLKQKAGTKCKLPFTPSRGSSPRYIKSPIFIITTRPEFIILAKGKDEEEKEKYCQESFTSSPTKKKF